MKTFCIHLVPSFSYIEQQPFIKGISFIFFCLQHLNLISQTLNGISLYSQHVLQVLNLVVFGLNLCIRIHFLFNLFDIVERFLSTIHSTKRQNIEKDVPVENKKRADFTNGINSFSLLALLGSPPKADAPLAQNLITDFLVGTDGLEPATRRL